MLSRPDTTNVEQTRDEIVDVLGNALQSAALVGEAASRGYRDGVSELRFAVVVDEVTPELLRSIRPRMPLWADRRVPVPLVLDPPYLANCADVFPLELLDLADRHEHLVGDIDAFADPAISSGPLRTQLEGQLRGKLLHLWENYIGTPDDPEQLASLLFAVPVAFDPIGRGLLYHASAAERPTHTVELIEAVGRTSGIPLDALAELEQRRRNDDPPNRAEAAALFDSVLSEMRGLARLIDVA